MPVRIERRMWLAPDVRSPALARRMLRAALEEAGLDELVDTAVLLASELCDNAVLHSGTEFEVQLTVSDTVGAGDGPEVTIAVADHGPGPLELHLAMPRTGRAASHGRGLLLVERLATSWGTRHDATGRHCTWFTLRPTADTAAGEPPAPEAPAAGPAAQAVQPGAPEPVPAAVEPVPVPAEPVPGAPDRKWPSTQVTRWLLHLPAALTRQLDLPVLVSEMLRRLCEVLDANGADVWADYGDGRREQELARHGHLPEPPNGQPLVRARLPLPAPLRGLLRLAPRDESSTAEELAELTAQRVALAVESDWLRSEDQRRRSWMSYLAESSELLAQSLDVELTVAMVPQLVVPRLGQWCAVHLTDEYGRLDLVALTHADEKAIPALRALLDTTKSATARNQLTAALRRAAGPIGIGSPSDGVAAALAARGRPIGTLTVGRFPDRPHSPEEIVLVSDLARRASLAIDNARTTAVHVETSQALQQALLPRQLPIAHGVQFAAEYLPASTGSDIGGDFYDVMAVGERRWLVSVGDVCGKGPRAAARTGQVRDVLRVLITEGRPLQRAIELLNGVMLQTHDPQQFCTLATALISRPDRGEPAGLGVELVLAGHERPVLVRSDGSTELIGEYGTAVGLVRDIVPACTRHWLRPGDALVICTDGVTDRRRGRELFGQDRLLAVLASSAGKPAAELVAAVCSAVEAFSRDPRRDDTALLAVRAAPDEADAADIHGTRSD